MHFYESVQSTQLIEYMHSTNLRILSFIRICGFYESAQRPKSHVGHSQAQYLKRRGSRKIIISSGYHVIVLLYSFKIAFLNVLLENNTRSEAFIVKYINLLG